MSNNSFQRQNIEGSKVPRLSILVTLCTSVLLSIAVLHSTALAGAWVQKKSGYFFKLTGTYLFTTEEYDSAGNVQPIRGSESDITNTSYREVAFTGYLEYGVNSRLTIVGNLPFKIVTSKRTEIPSAGGPMRNVEVVTAGLADLTLSGRLLLLGTSTPLSIQAGVKLPMGYEAAPPDQGAPLGSGKIDVEGMVLAGMGIWPVRFYLTGGFGYRLRGGLGIADEYLFEIEGGFTPGNWLVKATLNGIYSAKTPGSQGSATVTTTNQDVLKIIPTIAYRINRRFSVGIEAYHTAHGKNTVAGTTWVVGLVFGN
jgi:hypothetical protein